MALEQEGLTMEEEETEETQAPIGSSPSKKNRKKTRDPSAMRKAPQAPKRFKSSYICFFMAKQNEIKHELGEEASVGNISKRSAELWKLLSTAEREHWDQIAAKDKQRFMSEKASYSGPWQVPWKRTRKDPSAPKRPMSAFLYFSQGKRAEIKKQNPSMKNTEVSRILGEMWRNLTPQEKQPHVDTEQRARAKYKIAMAQWKKDDETRQEMQRKVQAEHAAALQEVQHPHVYPGDFPGMQPPMIPSPYSVYATPAYAYPYPTGPYHFPTNGRQPVILGPTGTPVYPAANAARAPGQQPAPAMHAAYPPPGYDDPPHNQGSPPGEPFDYSVDQDTEAAAD